jgi:hypothetical protein
MGGFANNAPIVTDGLVFYVDAGNSKSYPGSGTTWTDLIGGNNGSLTNMDATNHSSTNGGIFTFDGLDEYVDYGGDAINVGTNDFTISCWIKLSSLLPSFGSVLGKSYAGTGNRYFFGLDGDEKLVSIIADTSSGIVSTGTTALSSNVWYMITAVFDRSGNVSMYINDTSDTVASNADISSKNGSNITDSSIPLRIGSYAQADKTSPSFLFPGDIATSMIYFKALSAAEVSQNYNALKNRFV